MTMLNGFVSQPKPMKYFFSSLSGTVRENLYLCTCVTSIINMVILAYSAPGHILLPTPNGMIGESAGITYSPSSLRNRSGLNLYGSGNADSLWLTLHRFAVTAAPE